MRVVFLTHNYPRHPGDVAGAFLHPLAVALRDRGVDVHVVAPADRGNDDSSVIDGVPITRVRYASPEREVLAYTGNMASALQSLAGMKALVGMTRALNRGAREVLGTDQRGIVHAHWWVPAGLAAPDFPTVITCHGTDVRMLTRNRLIRMLGRRTLRGAGVVTTVSAPFAGMIADATGLSLDDVAVQPMPIANVDRPRSDRSGPVVTLGRLTAQKRFDLAIRAYRLARDAGFDRPLRMVGDGPERQALEALAGELELGNVVTFTGETAPEAVPTHLADASVMLMTSQEEGFGLAAAEGLIQGVPVVACTDGGGVLDIASKASGCRIVDPRPAAIATALRNLAGNRKAGDQAAGAGKRWALRLSPGAAADACLTWYDRVLWRR